jgi:hypothetical protein
MTLRMVVIVKNEQQEEACPTPSTAPFFQHPPPFNSSRVGFVPIPQPLFGNRESMVSGRCGVFIPLPVGEVRVVVEIIHPGSVE